MQAPRPTALGCRSNVAASSTLQTRQVLLAVFPFAVILSEANMAHSFHSRPSLPCLAWALVCASALFSCATSAQAQTSSGAVAPPLVTSKQGKQIAQTALQHDELGWNAQDCSHLVHQIYSAAGYGYVYASSFDLYAGQGNFRRVKHAQAGDLIAWRGHVGIVISPRAHP